MMSLNQFLEGVVLRREAFRENTGFSIEEIPEDYEDRDRLEAAIVEYLPLNMTHNLERATAGELLQLLREVVKHEDAISVEIRSIEISIKGRSDNADPMNS